MDDKTIMERFIINSSNDEKITFIFAMVFDQLSNNFKQEYLNLMKKMIEMEEKSDE